MKLHFVMTLAASAQAQLNQPQNGQLNGQLNSQLNSQVNTGVTGALPGSTTTNGVGAVRTPAPLGMTQPSTVGRTGAAIGTPGVTAPLGTIDNRAPTMGLGTSSVTNTSGNSLSPATGSSAPLNTGTWGGVNPNNTLAPAAGAAVIGTPGTVSGGKALKRSSPALRRNEAGPVPTPEGAMNKRKRRAARTENALNRVHASKHGAVA